MAEAKINLMGIQYPSEASKVIAIGRVGNITPSYSKPNPVLLKRVGCYFSSLSPDRPAIAYSPGRNA